MSSLVKIFKLVNYDEIITKVDETVDFNDPFIPMIDPIQIVSMPDGKGHNRIGFTEFPPYHVDPTLATQSIAWIADPSPEILATYQEFMGQVITPVPKKIII